LFLLVAYGGYILVKSVQQEIRRREEIQELTRKLTEVNLRLKELDKMKSEFLSVASHELNSPMSVIKGYLHMILYEGFGKVNKEAKTYLNHVYTKTDQLAKLVSDLLNVSRIEQGRVKLQIQPTDPMQIAKSAVENYNVKAREKGIEINLHQPDGVIPKVSADPGKLEEILSNLLSNSVKYTKEGHINLLFEKTDGEVKFTVKDTGIGIPKEAQKNIFKKFYRVDNTWVREAGGTGLGLYIIKGYVELMNGKIWFESEGENKGTTFYFTIPLAKASDAGKIEEKNLEFEEKNRPEYTESKFKPSEIKKEMKEVTENNKKEENKEGKPQSLKDQLLSHKEERARMKEKILKQAEEFRKKQKQ